MRVRAICCEIIFREACLLAANSPLVIDFDFLQKGLHDLGSEKMRARLQDAVDAVDASVYEATVLGYALCNNGVVGLTATRTKLVLPRAHDCITFFLGSRRRYQEHFEAYPGTYFCTTGWSERGSGEHADGSIQTQLGTNKTYQEYVEKYGEENARYILEALGGWRSAYSRMAYIDMGLEVEDRYAEEAREEARKNDWEFERLQGDWRLLKALLEGEWDDEDFLTLDVGDSIEPSFDDRIVASTRKPGGGCERQC